MMIRCFARPPFITTVHFASPPSITISASHSPSSSVAASRREISLSIIAVASSIITSSGYFSSPALAEFSEIPDSGGVKSLDLRVGEGEVPIEGDQVAIHYYGRLAAKQGWRFDSTYDHKDSSGDSVPFTFVLGSANVIPGIETAVRSMKVGGIRRVVIPPSQGYQNTSQEPLPPNFFDRQRLFTTIFNPTRLANGEGPSGDAGVRAWIQAGLPAAQLVLGLPFYGYAWRLSNANSPSYYAATTGSAISPDGSIGYGQIRKFIVDNGATTVYNSTVVGDYCYAGTTWIGYDDNQSIVAKVRYAKQKGLRGYFSWHVGADDNSGLSRAASRAWDATVATTVIRRKF